ncbi:M15 family metallopeptidase [Nonlabens marinus]|uniref:D-alanyl-D-alanine carboxypeptidase n=1 Tax=Nonlabens marinus S1-08 TaxID=1454201 RepID=W8VZU4_9FLAO|nr:M15 family metallopeptidase [Nonlabens marinus]BAO55181.1 D-alanyl-D-alanine carboxypeptidase [Nonlabens marinus S1-08]
MRYLLLAFLLFGTIVTAQPTADVLTGKSANANNSLESDTQTALKKMQTAALKDGIKIEVASGYRSFDRQRQIWNGKYKKYEAQGLQPDAIFDKIVEYSTVPGTSRHHWGTDMDLIDGNADYSGSVLVTDKFHGDGPFCKLKDWMDENSSKFGFELVYTMNENRAGFEYEPWHYSYAPVSKVYLRDYLTQIDFISFLRSQEIMGMDQISNERLTRYYKEHIQGVNPELQLEKE